MYLEELLEVAIGLIFVWLVISMATMQAQEVIASFSKKRAKDLTISIRNMIESKALFDSFYDHPLIRNLKEPATGWWDRLLRKLGFDIPLFDNPPYIPSETFATVLFDVVTNAGTPTSSLKGKFSALRREVAKLSADEQEKARVHLVHIGNLAQALAGATLAESKIQINAEINSRLSELGKISSNKEAPLAALATELVESLSKDTDKAAELLYGVEPFLEQIRKGAINSGTTGLANAINSLLAGAEEYATDADKALAIGRKNVEAWFDNSMDRLSSWYKRWAQAWTFFIGLVLACTLNVDSIGLANHLWREPAIRQVLAANATKFVSVNPNVSTDGETTLPDVVKDLQEKFVTLGLPVGWIYETHPILTDDSSGEFKIDPASGLRLCPHPETFETYVSEGNQPYRIVGKDCVLYSNLPTTTGEWTLKLLGIFLTAIAAMQGAPIWFDLLKKLINVRNTGINPADKPKAGSDKER